MDGFMHTKLRFNIILLLLTTCTSLLLNNKQTYSNNNPFSFTLLCQSNKNRQLFDENTQRIPSTSSSTLKSNIVQLGKVAATALGTIFIIPSKSSKTSISNAVGNIYELQKQNIVMQDIAFNVPDGQVEFDALNALCQNTLKILRQTKTATTAASPSTSSSSSSDRISSPLPSLITVVGFGPDQYTSPSSFHPGISTFYEDGGHATLTFKSSLVPPPAATTTPTPVTPTSVQPSTSTAATSVTTAVNKKYGSTDAEVKFIKIGTEVLRLSKGIEKGMVVKYAYGWIDLESPGGVPYEVILGLTRDPLMMIALEVSDLQKSEQFYTSILGMKKIPFPLARDPASQYEPKQPVKPVNSVHLGYGPDSMSLLLIEKSVATSKKNFFGISSSTPKGTSITSSTTATNVKPLLDSLTLVFDDTQQVIPTDQSVTTTTEPLPSIYQTLISNSNPSNSSSNIVYSPDGLKIILKPYSVFNRNHLII